MLIYVEGKSFLGRTFVLTCDGGDTIGKLKALLLHILHDLGRSDHFFRLRFDNVYLREPLTLKDYNICEMSVLQMVPTSFGRHVRAETAAGVPRPFTSVASSTLTAVSQPHSPGSQVGALTMAALRKEVSVFKRQHLLRALWTMMWVMLVSTIVSFATVYWWSGFWLGITVVASLYFMPIYVHVGGTVGRMSKWDKTLMVVYSAAFVIVAAVNLVMFVYLLVAVVIEGDCSSYPDSDSLLGCSHQLWLSLVLYPIQSVILFSSSCVAISLWSNFRFEAGLLVEPTLTKVKEVNSLLHIAQNGSVRDRRQVAFELSNTALLGGQGKQQIASNGGLQVLTSMMSGDDEVTQEYAAEAIGELLSTHASRTQLVATSPTEPTPIQEEFVSQGGVAMLCALLHSPNQFIVEKAALSLSYLTSSCLGNRIAVLQERGLNDLQKMFTKRDSAVQLLASQILMNFATCGESRPFVLEHDSLLDSLVDGVGEKFGRQAVRAFTLRALVELGTEDKSVVISRPRLIKSVLDVQEDMELQHSALQILLWFAQDSQGMKQLLTHSNLISSLQVVVQSVVSSGDTRLAVMMVELISVMLKKREHRATLIYMQVRDLLEDIQDSWKAIVKEETELNHLLSECWQLLSIT